MTRPTVDEVRAEPAGRRLDAWCEWLVFGHEIELLSSWWVCGSHGRIPPERYSTDPAACAELRRHVIADKRWQYVNVQHYRDRVVVGTVPEPDVESWVEVEERGTDPIAAECVAWCKVALLASLNETAPARAGAE